MWDKGFKMLPIETVVKTCASARRIWNINCQKKKKLYIEKLALVKNKSIYSYWFQESDECISDY